MYKPLSIIAIATATAFSLGSCASSSKEGLKSLDASLLSDSIAAGSDFYEHVTERWQKAHPLTAEYSRYGQFNVLNDSSENRVKEIVTGLAATNPEPGTVAFKVSTIYNQAMDSVRRNNEGAEPIKADLARIEAAPADSMTDLFLWIHTNYSSPFFGGGPMENMANSNEYAMYIGGGSMGLPDRDYYLADDERNTSVREAYKKLILAQLANAGYDEATASRIMNTVMKIETEQAKDAKTREESRNIQAMYNPRTFAQLKSDYPALPWDRFFIETMGIESPDTVIVTDPKAMTRANAQMASLSDREKKDYYIWKYVAGAAPYLSDAFADASFEFNKVYSGVQEQRPRWKRALGATEGAMGEAVGQLYVEKYFPASSKEKMLTLVGNLKDALGQHIDSLTWMSEATKARAHEKLNAFTVKIGYPDKWRDYSGLDIDPAKPYWKNIQDAIIFNQEYNLADFGKPVDRERWYMSPQTVNAYYSPLTNEICFPAGILQKPFFDPEADDAINYGAIGVVIGHEMTHGFDDQGRQFDKDGNLADWWTEDDAKAFNALADSLAAQFDAIEVAPGTHANGRFTLGENIADQGGLRVAHTAYHNSLGGNEGETIDGFTPDQRFYLAYANVWAGNIREAEILQRTKTDPHSLGRWRVNATLRNIEPFFAAFGIEEGQPMFRPAAERVVIW